jgi:hypothetical protein
MKLATAAWEGMCGVKFLYKSELDSKEISLGEVSFPVVRQNGGGTTIAMAFFPNSPIDERLVYVFDGFYNKAPGSFDPTGVLRHELGHALGFRHEHIVPEAPDYFVPEDTNHIHRLTDYDPQSVMHYVGPGVGNPKLEFTTSDRVGAVDVYGRPHSQFDNR